MKISKAMTESMTNPTATSERLLYPDLSSVSERLIDEKIQANDKLNNNINIIKDIRNYYETETNNYNKKLSRYKNYITKMYILSRQFSDKFNKLYTKSMKDNKIDNDEYNELVKVYEENKKNRRSRNSVDKKNKLGVFFRLKLLVLSNNNVFSNNNISINIYR